MSLKKKTNQNTEINISFAKHNDQQVRQDNQLNIEMLRVHATEKQRIMKDIWAMDQQQLCEYFTSYQLFPQKVFALKQLLDSANLKLIKTGHKLYFGQIERKKKEGKGICIYKQGKIYEGEFQDDQRSGIGVQIYSNGNLYIGDFLTNKKHGSGQFFWFNLLSQASKDSNRRTIEYYDGEWWGGLPDGEGLHQKINGDLFSGVFKNGLKHGLGTQNFGNGDYYRGEYINGLPEGFGQYIWADGSYYKGDFKQGLRSGYGFWALTTSATENSPCERYQGHYAMDKKSGYGVYEWENGWIYKGNFENDYRNGYGQLFDNGKAVYKGYWQNGEKVDSDRMIHTGKISTRTNASVQMSRTLARHSDHNPGYKNQDNDYNIFSTVDIGTSVPHRYKIEPKLTLRPEFTIRKRPQSHVNLQQPQVKKKRSSSTARKLTYNLNNQQKGDSIGTSISRPILKNNLYVPGYSTERKRGY